jgi:uncharacterized protein
MLTLRVDADACPTAVRINLEKLARRCGIELIFYIDDSHELHPAYGQVLQVGQGRDAVDLVLANQIIAGDIVVTQDYGLAALALARQARAIHPAGMAYTEANIDRLLFERHLAAKSRQARERSHPPTRTGGSGQNLVAQLQQWIEESKGNGEPPGK